LAAALREVVEETGVRCEAGEELPSRHYVDRHGRSKVVRYWQMTPVATTAWQPDDEVDDVVWIAAADAGSLLTYDSDRELVADVVRGGRGEHHDHLSRAPREGR
jgi:8-oxo-dGTP diphosphatase